MATEVLTPLDAYLNTSYTPDRDFVDGVPVERNVGTPKHSDLQGILIGFFRQFRSSHSIKVFPEARLRVDAATGRHRIPDVMIVEIPYHKDKVIVDVPAIIVEVKSPDDSFDDVIERCIDYERLGVPHILVMDPDHRLIWFYRDGSFIRSSEATGLFVSPSIAKLELKSGKHIELPYDQMFAELDE